MTLTYWLQQKFEIGLIVLAGLARRPRLKRVSLLY